MVFDVDGGAVTNGAFTFRGTNVTVRVRNGSLTYWNGRVLKDGFNFVPGKTANTVLRIEDDGLVKIVGTVNFGSNGIPSYNWTNCPNSAIEFTGRNPTMRFADYWENYQVLGLGTEDETPLTDPVRLRFIVPETNYAAAPMRGECQDLWIYGNQPIEVALENGVHPRKTMKVPLIYDRNGFRVVNMNADRVAKLNANAILPEGAKLAYNSATKTLECVIPGVGGTMVIVR